MFSPSLGLTEAAKSVLQTNYSNCEGRARRSEYWMFVLFNFLVLVAASIFLAFLESSLRSYTLTQFFALIVCFYLLYTFIPSIAVIVRRFHDTGKSGLCIFLPFIPVVGLIIFNFFM